MKNKIKKIVITIILIILNVLGVINSVNAAQITSANVYKIGDCGSLLTYKGSPIVVSYIEYVEKEEHYPAYCMDVSKPGAEKGAYTVNVQNTVNDIRSMEKNYKWLSI